MKVKVFVAIAVICALLTEMAMAEGISGLDRRARDNVMIYPEDDKVDSLDQITLTIEGSDKFGAFVYMPSLYAVNKDGSIGEEVSACRLIGSSARGADTLRFKVLNPPTRSGRYAFIIKDNSFSTVTHSGNSSETSSPESPDGLEMKARASGQAFINFPVDLERDTLRILHISNSYGGNLLYYVNDLLRAAGVDVSKVLVGRLMYSSGTFKNWYDVSNDKNSKSYWYYKMAGGLQPDLEACEGGEKDGAVFRQMIEGSRWDLIILNQASAFTPFYENWNSNGDGGYLPELLTLIRKHHPKVPVGFLLIHSYAENYVGNTQHWSTLERWERIRDSVHWLRNAYDVDFIVPYGTAIQNLRLTGYNNAHDLTGDGTHLAGGLAQYTAGCCYFETVFGPRFKSSVYGNSLRLPEPEIQYADKYEGCVIPVDDASAETAQKAAFLACHNMFEVRNPDLADLRDYVYGEALNTESYCKAYELNCSECVDGLTGEAGGPPYRVCGPSGILIGISMSEEEWSRLPAGFYIRNGEKIFKSR
ncbi:MAG: DUF4886 domain-containing protein [Muribaculaceae bacterium]|nr:DUF4886 domain-containing protein [Muribaculaceae bacterium]